MIVKALITGILTLVNDHSSTFSDIYLICSSKPFWIWKNWIELCLGTVYIEIRMKLNHIDGPKSKSMLFSSNSSESNCGPNSLCLCPRAPRRTYYTTNVSVWVTPDISQFAWSTDVKIALSKFRIYSRMANRRWTRYLVAELLRVFL